MDFNSEEIKRVKEGKDYVQKQILIDEINKKAKFLAIELNSLIEKWEELYIGCFLGELNKEEYARRVHDLSREVKEIQEQGNKLIDDMRRIGIDDKFDINNILISLGTLSSNTDFINACDLGCNIYINKIEKILKDGNVVLDKAKRIQEIIIKYPYNKKCVMLAEYIIDSITKEMEKVASVISKEDYKKINYLNFRYEDVYNYLVESINNKNLREMGSALNEWKDIIETTIFEMYDNSLTIDKGATTMTESIITLLLGAAIMTSYMGVVVYVRQLASIVGESQAIILSSSLFVACPGIAMILGNILSPKLVSDVPLEPTEEAKKKKRQIKKFVKTYQNSSLNKKHSI